MKTNKDIEIKYYDEQGNTHIRCCVPVLEGALVHFELMQSHYCKLSFKSGIVYGFKLGDFIETDFGRFELIDNVQLKNEDALGYSYELQFDAYYRKWKNKRLKYMPKSGSPEGTFTLTSNIRTHANIIIDNLDFLARLSKSYLYDSKFIGEGTDFTFVVDASVDATKPKAITYSNSSILDAIANIAQTFECEWWLEGNIIHFGTCENTNQAVDFINGENIISISSSQSQANYANRVYAFGAARNLPSGYKQNVSADVTKNGVVEKRLMLPTIDECSDANKKLFEDNGFELKDGCLQVKGLTEDQYVEGITTNNDIYPRNLIKTSKVTSYEKEVEDESTAEKNDYIKRTFFRVGNLAIVNEDGEKTGEMAFRSSYILSGQTLHIIFQSGSLNGMDFECQFNPDGKPEIIRDEKGEPILKDGKEQINPESQVFEIVANESYGRFLPDTALPPKDGDTFVLYNWDATKLGDTLVISSANELLTDTIKNLKKSMIDPTTYTCTASSDYSYNSGKGLLHLEGDRVNLYSRKNTTNFRASRIIGYELHLDIPFDSVKYTVGEKPAYSRLNAMSSKIEELVFNGQSYLNKGGGNGIYIIKSYDSTRPSEYNVYSAKAVDTQRLSKTKDDTASGFITFLKGIQAWGKSLFESVIVSKDLSVAGSTKLGEPGTKTTFGDFTHDSTGAQIAVDEDGTSRAEFDFITIRRAADFREITIRELKYIGGELAITPAAMEVSKVEKVTGGYKCYFEAEDGNGKRKVYQEFLAGDQARCQQFAMKDSVQGERKTTKYYWRLVTEVGDNYIVLSDKEGEKDAQELGNSVPEVGDNIVQLGYQGSDCPNRQSAIIFSATAQDAPSSKYYQGIDSFSLGGCVVKDEGFDSAKGTFSSKVYGDAFIGDKDEGGYLRYDAESKTMTFKGTAHFDSATMGDDGQPVVSRGDLANLGTHSGNLLLNTSFLGDFESEEISEETDITEDKQMYSSSVKHWEMANASINGDEDSASGRSVTFGEGGGISQTMKKPLEVGAHYILSFRGKGTKATVHVGGEEHEVAMSEEVKRYSVPFTAAKLDALFALACDHGTVMELILTEGNVIAEWTPSFEDNDRSLQELQNYQYLAHAISEGSTTIDGGLVLSEQFRVGNYRNRTLQKETGGMSGIYNSEDSPFIWGGGDMRRAIYTIQRYKGNETATISEEEVKEKMANFVVTHGGRVILQDVIARGYIYAEGGVMRSVKSPNGNFEIDEQGNVSLKGHIEAESGKIGAFSIGYEEGEKSLGSVIYYGISSFTEWASESGQDIAIMSQNSFRVGFSFLGGTYGRAAMGKNCDPTATDKIPGASVLYAGYNGGLGGRLYQPVMKIEAMSEQGEGRISARLIGGVQVHQGGIMEQGQCVTEANAEDIDISKGTTIILRNGDGTKVKWYFIPTYEKACQQLGVDGGIAFAVTMKLLCALNVNGCSNKVCIANRAEDGTGKVGMEQAGRFVDNNGNEWGIGSRYLEQGDCMEIALVYTPETGYYAQVIYKHD